MEPEIRNQIKESLQTLEKFTFDVKLNTVSIFKYLCLVVLTSDNVSEAAFKQFIQDNDLDEMRSEFKYIVEPEITKGNVRFLNLTIEETIEEFGEFLKKVESLRELLLGTFKITPEQKRLMNIIYETANFVNQSRHFDCKQQVIISNHYQMIKSQCGITFVSFSA
jgi:hypothetical protein